MTPIEKAFGLEGQRILVTGASSGIGRATSILLSRLGANLVLVGRDLARLSSTFALLDSNNHAIEVFDLKATDEISSWIRTIATRYGPLDGLVHSAGNRQTLPIRSFSAAAFDGAFRLNLAAALALTAGFRHASVSPKGGSVVFLSSVAGLAGESALSLYCAAKGAIIAAVRALAVELAPQGIRVNCVAPGLVETEMTAKIREALSPDQFKAIEAMHVLGIGSSEDVAGCVAFLLGNASRWVTGTTLVVDGGYLCR